MYDKISIIIPVYNAKKYLSKCVNSVLNQSYKNLEVILVDDGSTDGSGEICDKFCKTDQRIKVIHKDNGGPSECRNIGVKNSTGKYIGFVDSDDYIDENMYKALYNSLYDNQADIAQIGHAIVSDNQIVDRVHGDNSVVILRENDIVREIIKDELINSFTWDKLFKRELFDDFEFINLSYHEDLASMSILLSKSKKYVCNNIPLYYYVRNEDSISHTLTPKKYYDSYNAYKIREKVIYKCCPDMLVKNALHKFEMGICALNCMIREQKSGIVQYNEEINSLMIEMKRDRKQILFSSKAAYNVKIYLLLLSNFHLYKFVCLLDLHKNTR